MSAIAKLEAVQPPRLRVFAVEVRTQDGHFARYDAIALGACDALLDALDTWGIANISISPR